MYFKPLERMPEGIKYVRDSIRFDEVRKLKFTDFIDDGGRHFMREVGPDTDVWVMLVPAWYECWPARIEYFLKSMFSTPK